MQGIKKVSLLAITLTLAIVLCAPTIFAKAENNSQNQNQQATGTQNQERDQERNQENNNAINGEDHRSDVATFVQKLLDVANREKGGIGDQVKAIATAQNDSKENIASEIDKVKNRSSLKTFLIGTDYKTLGQLRSEIVKTENQINQLNNLLDKTTSADNKTTLEAQIKVLEDQKQKIDTFITSNESKFSLFGWLTKILNK